MTCDLCNKHTNVLFGITRKDEEDCDIDYFVCDDCFPNRDKLIQEKEELEK